ncbi:MAG: YraN family protein [Pseudomonadota bacterium]
MARHYERLGLLCLAERWKGAHGEIDLIFQDADGALVFVEVKASHRAEDALHALGPRQQARLLDSASAFLALMPRGQRTPCRIDVAAYDGVGAMTIVENALAG